MDQLVLQMTLPFSAETENSTINQKERNRVKRNGKTKKTAREGLARSKKTEGREGEREELTHPNKKQKSEEGIQISDRNGHQSQSSEEE